MGSIPESQHHFIVGTFNTPHIYTLTFSPPNRLKIINRADAIGSHSWLHLSTSKKNLYATAWTEPPSVVAYTVESPTKIHLIGRANTASRSGYVTATEKAVYSAGGASGEVFSLDPTTGNFTTHSKTTINTTTGAVPPLQTLNFVDTTAQRDDGSVMDFGGLRHGAHSADLSPDESAIYIADIGRNCIWTYSVSPTDGSLTLTEKHISPRPTDGPRHVWPHPSGNYVYSLQEHTSMVDVFSTTERGTKLKHEEGIRIIPAGLAEGDFWADEVRTSLSHGQQPKYLYASTRGLKDGVKGYVAVFALTSEGLIDHAQGQKGLLDMWQTPTSGGWANAIQPGPTIDGVEYSALTDSEQGLVMVLSWDGNKITEVARVKLDEGAGAATAVWL